MGAREGRGAGEAVEGGYVAPFDECDEEQDERATYAAFKGRAAERGE